MPYFQTNTNGRPSNPVKPIVITSYDFNSKMISGSVTCPKVILHALEDIALRNAPKDAKVREAKNSTIVELNDKRMTISVWMVKTADVNTRPFKQLAKENYDVAVVASIHFYENGKFVNLCDECSSKIAVGVDSKVLEAPKLDTPAARAMAATRKAFGLPPETEDTQLEYYVLRHVKPIAVAASKVVYDFFVPEDDLMSQTISWLESNDDTAEVKQDSAHSFSAKIKLKDYDVSADYRTVNNGAVLSFTIYHKYTETDRVYGAEYTNTRKEYKIKSAKDLDSIDYKALMDYLWKYRAGEQTYSGSLGT